MITHYGTLIHLTYSVRTKEISKIRVTSYLKDLASFKLSQIVVSNDHKVICMLIDPDCICLLRLNLKEDETIMNESG